MSGTKLKKTFSSLIVLMLALGIIVMINLFAQKHFKRIDLTDEKQYTLSETSRRTVGNLQDVLTVTVYMTKDLPQKAMDVRDEIVDILEEYQSYSKNRMRLKYVDPGDDEEMKAELALLGIQQVQMQVPEKDKVEIVNIYFGMSVRYKDRVESIPIIAQPASFEYTMTATILKVASAEVKTIGFLKGHDEYDPYIELGALGDNLQNQYRITPVNLGSSPQVPANVNMLVIAKPEGDFPAWELFAIDQFLMNGGSLVVLRDPIKMLQNQLAPEVIYTNLDSLLAHYGLRFGDELVLDRYNQQASFNMGRGMMMTTPYPFWVKVVKDNMDENNPAMTNISEIMLPWTTWIEVDEREGLDVSKVLLSSEFSWTQPANNLNPQQQFTPAPEKMQSRILAARISGKFESFYKGRDIPKKPQESDEARQMLMAFPEDKRVDDSVEDGVILAVGNARFITGEVLRQTPLNLHFLMNSIDQIALGDDLIQLRARGIKPRLIEEKLDDRMRSRIKLLNIFGMPFAVLLFALARGLYRRARRAGN